MVESPFEMWLIAACFEARILKELERENRWSGLYFYATDEQKYLALSLLERLILSDEDIQNFRLHIERASVEHCSKIINHLFQLFDEQVAAFDPVKRLKYYQNHE